MKPIKAKKSLGQNFLIDEEALHDIAESIDIAGRHIIEVGPGYGALTEYIVSHHPSTLDLVELDPDMIEILDERYMGEDVAPVIRGEDNVLVKTTPIAIHHQDVLTFTPPYDEYSVIANIPYYITSPILFHFLYPYIGNHARGGVAENGGSGVETVLTENDYRQGNGESEGATLSERRGEQGKDERQQRRSKFVDPSGAFGTFQSGKVQAWNPPAEMTIMMQEEVGEKILAGRAKKPHHSYLSLAMELACTDIDIVRYVGRASFDPAPKVDSIVLRFRVKQERNREIEEKLLALWRISFAQPRKTLLSNLRGSHYDIDVVKKWLAECGYDEKVRAEAVRKEDWENFF